MTDFKGKTVLITGSRGGIGRAMITAFAERGANIIAHARKPDADFENELAEEANRCDITIQPLYFDLTDTEGMKSEIRELLKNITPDVLINNAGIAHVGLLQLTPIKKIKEVFEINLFSAMALTQLILPAMAKRKSGNILNMASTLGIYLKPGNSTYGVSKAALIAWTKTLALEIGPMGLRINALAPGVVDTELTISLQSQTKAGSMRQSAMGRNATPKEVANVATFITSDDASYINGEIVCIDGGPIL